MKVEKLMTRNPVSCTPEDDLSVPARLMWEADCGCVPVVDRDRRVVGMVTDRDVCMAAYTQGRPLREMRVGEVMSNKVHACRMADDLEVAERMMKTRQVRRLPVLDTDERLVGMLSLNDLALRAAREVSPDQVASVRRIPRHVGAGRGAARLHGARGDPPLPQAGAARPRAAAGMKERETRRTAPPRGAVHAGLARSRGAPAGPGNALNERFAKL